MAGTSARGLLKSWVQLRMQDARCRQMLEKIEVMQQPAGFCDGIIAKWRIESTQRSILRVFTREI